ncbi:hypothetical protein ACLK2A_01810 [Escherichia coli]
MMGMSGWYAGDSCRNDHPHRPDGYHAAFRDGIGQGSGVCMGRGLVTG